MLLSWLVLLVMHCCLAVATRKLGCAVMCCDVQRGCCPATAATIDTASLRAFRWRPRGEQGFDPLAIDDGADAPPAPPSVSSVASSFDGAPKAPSVASSFSRGADPFAASCLGASARDVLEAARGEAARGRPGAEAARQRLGPLRRIAA